MFANTQMGGTNVGSPDTCLTPPYSTPTTYANTSQTASGVPAAYTILLAAAPAHNLGTTVPTSNGDEAGTYTGVTSGTIMGPTRKTTAANTILMGGMPATRMTSATMQNSTNSVGVALSPSQTKILLLAP